MSTATETPIAACRADAFLAVYKTCVGGSPRGSSGDSDPECDHCASDLRIQTRMLRVLRPQANEKDLVAEAVSELVSHLESSQI